MWETGSTSIPRNTLSPKCHYYPPTSSERTVNSFGSVTISWQQRSSRMSDDQELPLKSSRKSASYGHASRPNTDFDSFEVAFDTTFEALQALRGRMLAFCKANARDFQPVFDVIVDDIPAQGKMVLKADIRYKSNWQQGALRVQRRNKWICALKLT